MPREPRCRHRLSSAAALAFCQDGVGRSARCLLLSGPDFGHNLLPITRFGFAGRLKRADQLPVADDLEGLSFRNLIQNSAGFVMKLPGIEDSHNVNVSHSMLHVNAPVLP